MIGVDSYGFSHLSILSQSSQSCWNLIPSSDSQKRRNSSLADPVSKQSVHQPANEVSQSANLIDLQPTRHPASSLEFPVDYQQSRTSEDKTQTTDSHTKRTKSNLFDRITLPHSGKVISSRATS
ncbi:hypothetical protein PSTG_04154 [Puccinia striiformis f. sp. tritici PST-78]|uniref:Uncharacterized protein n=1 Tax=Puccinia striiformis f. sp. tritici PST-78 TaxID=1165861 RepID=A0A0L0VTM6_9BASI|nr:hypothetical protein PSTG_04154 [Puccinia striiformis f. sp. tritici PST-78]